MPNLSQTCYSLRFLQQRTQVYLVKLLSSVAVVVVEELLGVSNSAVYPCEAFCGHCVGVLREILLQVCGSWTR